MTACIFKNTRVCASTICRNWLCAARASRGGAGAGPSAPLDVDHELATAIAILTVQ